MRRARLLLIVGAVTVLSLQVPHLASPTFSCNPQFKLQSAATLNPQQAARLSLSLQAAVFLWAFRRDGTIVSPQQVLDAPAFLLTLGHPKETGPLCRADAQTCYPKAPVGRPWVLRLSFCA